MKLLEQSKQLLSKKPLPDDALEQLDALIAQATGQEKRFLIRSHEALYVVASPEQLEKWHTEKAGKP